jgi:hypothetical protein
MQYRLAEPASTRQRDFKFGSCCRAWKTGQKKPHRAGCHATWFGIDRERGQRVTLTEQCDEGFSTVLDP